MSAIAIPPPTRPDRPRLDEPAAEIRPARTEPSLTPTTPTASRHGRGGRVLFEIPFHSAMTDADLARLARTLDLSTHMVQKMRPSPTSPGVACLDHFSGLFLDRGEAEGEWLLEARTWGSPAPESVHGWHLLAAGAARELDPRVKAPERLPVRDARVEVPDRPVGEALNRRLAAFRRHLVGLS
jgi:hypothetical protein